MGARHEGARRPHRSGEATLDLAVAATDGGGSHRRSANVRPVSFFLEMGFWMTSRHDLDVMPGSHERSGQRPRVILHAADVVAGNGDDADPHGPRMLAETAVPTRGPERTRRRVVVVDEWGLRGLRTAVFELA